MDPTQSMHWTKNLKTKHQFQRLLPSQKLKKMIFTSKYGRNHIQKMQKNWEKKKNKKNLQKKQSNYKSKQRNSKTNQKLF